MTTILRTNDNDFTVHEIEEYENEFLEPFEQVFDDARPQTKKIAFIAYLKARRENPNLQFQDYLRSITASPLELVGAAFGDFRPETEDDSWTTDDLRKERALRMARFCMGTGFAPSEYFRLTYIEQQAFIDVIEERNKKAKGKRR